MTPRRILIVDDDVRFARLVKLNLEQEGSYEIHVETHGKTALKAAKAFKPDLVLLDIIMPDLDGGDIANQIQKDPDLKGTRIVFLTATVRKQEIQANQGKIGGFPFIAKPVTARDLAQMIEQQLKP